MTKVLRPRATGDEVALRAGVSRTTVSFVLNDIRNKGISDATRQRVLDVASDLGYQPNAAARTLAGGSTGTIAVVIARSDDLHFDAYLPRLLSTINDRCHRYGYKVLIESADEQLKRPGAFIDLVRSRSIDGLIVANMRTVDGRYVLQLFEQGFPIVVPGNGAETFYSRCASNCDENSAHVATTHLIGLGHRRIAHLPFSSKAFDLVVQRHAGYQRALAENGIAYDRKLVSFANITAESGYVAMKKVLKRKVAFTAVFAGNDTIAYGAMQALDEAGLEMPGDVAVVGYDDLPLSAFVRPALTTMRTDPVLQGTEAVDMLMARIGGQAYCRLETCYETRLVIRKSCGQKVSEARL